MHQHFGADCPFLEKIFSNYYRGKLFLSIYKMIEKFCHFSKPPSYMYFPFPFFCFEQLTAWLFVSQQIYQHIENILTLEPFGTSKLYQFWPSVMNVINVLLTVFVKQN